MGNSLKSDARLRAVLDRLHAQSDAQTSALMEHLSAHGRASIGGSEPDVQAGRGFWRDKLVALDRPKAEFCYALCRATGARRIVEAGTSYGLSTLYLAAALRDNGGGTVIATEYEPEKVRAARSNWAEAGLAEFIELHEGDLRETLNALEGPIDFLLLDIWTPMVRPALERVVPHMRTGAVVVADNTAASREAYAEYFAFVAEAANGFSTMTLPFEGGLEFAVKTG